MAEGCRSLADRKDRVAAPRDHKVLPRWRFLTQLDGNEYYYQVLLLNVPFRSEGGLISERNASKNFKEECFLRNLIEQGEDALNSLDKASRLNFSVTYIRRLAKMLIMRNIEALEAVNSKLMDIGLDEVNLSGDDGDPGGDSESYHSRFLDDLPGDVERSDLLRLVGHKPVTVVKDDRELRASHAAACFPADVRPVCRSRGCCFSQTRKSFLIHTVVGQLTYSQDKCMEVLATSGPAAYLLGGSTIHRFFRLDVEMKTRLEFGTLLHCCGQHRRDHS